MRRADFKRKTRVIVVDDNYDHASGIRELINLEQDYEVIANAGNVNVAISLIKKYQPDIVLMDINMPETDGITAISEIEKLGLKTRIIALTGYDEADLIYRAMKNWMKFQWAKFIFLQCFVLNSLNIFKQLNAMKRLIMPQMMKKIFLII